jgi:hypothetical protein
MVLGIVSRLRYQCEVLYLASLYHYRAAILRKLDAYKR